MADNTTKIVITAEDKASAVLGKVGQSMGAMAGAFGLAGTVSAAGLGAMVKSSIDAADNMNDLSKKVGINIQALAGWQLAASQSGTSIETVAKGIKGLSAYMVDHTDKLKAAGITAKDADGALLQLADLFKDMPDGVEKTALAVELFGKAGMDMIPMLNEGSAGLETARAKAAAYGAKMAELAPLADQFNDQMEELALHSKAAGMNITAYFIPGLVGLSQWLNDVASGGKKAWNAIAWIVGGLPEGVTLGENDKPAPKAPGLMLPGGNSPAEAAALARAKLLNPPKTGAAGKTGKVGKAFDPEGDLFFDIEEAQRKKHRAALDAEEKTLENLRKKYIDLADPLQKYRDQLDEINTLQELGAANGGLNADQAIEAIWQVNEAMDAQIAKMNDVGEAARESDNFARDMGLTFSSAFEDAAISGKKLSDVMQGLAEDIQRILLRKVVTEPLGKAVSGLFENFDIGSMFGGGRASGGPVSAGQYYVVGEKGPEILVPGSSGTVLPNSAGSGGNLNIVVNNTAAPEVTATATARNNGGGFDVEIIVQKAIANDMTRNGPITQALGSMFGLQRAV